MKCKIRGEKIKVTSAIQEYVENKLSRLDKYFKSENVDASVLIRVKGKEQTIEVTIPYDKYTLRSEERRDDLYAAIDLVIDKLEGQIRKMKTKKDQQNMTESIRLKEMVREEEGELVGEIIKTLYYEIKPLDPEDAKLKLEERPQDKFLAFINIATGKVNVIYRLKDNKYYGLVEPEA